MSKLVLFGCSLVLVFAILVNKCDSRPYQFLPSREGYVPVYIRMGDTPLDEINPELAVAFHEMVAVNGRQLKSNDEYVSSPQAVKLAPVEQKVEIKHVTAEHIEPQPVEHETQ